MLLTANGATQSVACENCGGKRLERDQPSGTGSDGDLRNMVDPATQLDQGGNPLAEGIWANNSWQPMGRRDESYASVKTAATEVTPPLPGGLHNGPLALLSQLKSIHVNGEHVNPETIGGMFQRYGMQGSPEYGAPVTVEAHHPAFEQVAAKIVRDGHGMKHVYQDDVGALMQGCADGSIPPPTAPPRASKTLEGSRNRALSMEPYLPWTHDVLEKTAAAIPLEVAGEAAAPLAEEAASAAGDAAGGFFKGIFNKGLSLLKPAAGNLMQGALKGVGEKVVGDVMGGGGGQMPSGPTGPRDISQVSHVVADYSTPTSNPGYHDSPDGDTHQFSDGDHDPNFNNPNNQDSGASGEDNVPGGFGENSPGMDRLQMLLPLILHHYNKGDGSGADDPMLRQLHEQLESEFPGYQDHDPEGGAQAVKELLAQLKEPHHVHAAVDEEWGNRKKLRFQMKKADIAHHELGWTPGMHGRGLMVGPYLHTWNAYDPKTVFETNDVGMHHSAYGQMLGEKHGIDPNLINYGSGIEITPDGQVDQLSGRSIEDYQKVDPRLIPKSQENPWTFGSKVANPVMQPQAVPQNNQYMQGQQQGMHQPGQPCPFCGGPTLADGSCPQCGSTPNPQGGSTPGQPLNTPQNNPSAMAFGTVPRMGSNHQGPETDEQKAAVSELLIHQGRKDEIPNMLQNPWQYSKEMDMVAQSINTPPNLQPGEQPAPPPPAQEDAPPGDTMPMPNPASPQMQAKVATPHSGAPRCPDCKSATTGFSSNNAGRVDCMCHSCGKTWKVDGDIMHTSADGSPPAPLAAPDPTAQPQNDSSQTSDSTQTWQTNDGQPLEPGMTYEMHSPQYKIPDIVKIVAVKPDSITVETVGDAPSASNDEAQPLSYQHEVSRKEADLEQLTFVPSDGQQDDPAAEDDTPVNTQVQPTPQPQMHSHVEPQDDNCPKCSSTHLTSSMSSPDTEFHECYKCGHGWETRDSFAGREASSAAWLLEDSGPGGDDFFSQMERHQDKRQGGASRSLTEIAQRDDRLQAIKHKLDVNAEARTSGKKFSPREQREFIDEDGTARNADKLELEGTHYHTRYLGPKANGENVRDADLFLGL
jgi:DNA-directed RNA polymerase subunit M/transcription elongation factor TFIIS